MPVAKVKYFRVAEFLVLLVLCMRGLGGVFAETITISGVEGTNFVQGGTATVTGSVTSTTGAIEGVTYQALDEESQGTDSTAFTAGTRDSTFDSGNGGGLGANSTVRSISTQSDGKVLIGGEFTTYNGTTRNRIVRLNSDGTLDTSFNPGTGANNIVFSIITQSDGKILIGGGFTSYNGTARNYIARLNTDGSLDTSFDPGTGANYTVYSISTQSDGKILIIGYFTTYNGTARNYIARLNSDGTLDTSFDQGTGANSYVYSISTQSDGKILIGGQFASYNGTSRNRVARINSDGTLDTSFDPGTGANSTVYSINTQSDGKILIGGSFTSYNGTTRNNVARINTDGTLDTSFDPGTGTNYTVQSISTQSDGKILIGGEFTSYNGTARNYIARLNSNGSLDTSFDPGTGANSTVQSIGTQSDGKISIGGYFTTYNGTIRSGIARLNSNGTLDSTFDPGTGANSTVYSISTQSDGKILIGGNFTSYNGTTRNRIARLNSDGTLDTSFDPGTGASSNVLSIITQSDGKILIGGNFTSYNGTTRNRVARLNADGTLDTSFDPGTGANNTVYSIITQSDGKILIGGWFTTYNGTTRNYIARLNSDGSLDTSFDPGTGANTGVTSINTQSDGKVLIGGAFTTYNGTTRRYIARLNADGSLDTSFDPGTGANSTVYSINTQSDGKILIGGDFYTYNGTTRNYIARLNSDGTLDASFNPGPGANNVVYSISTQSDGKILIGGQFTIYNGTTRNRIARLNSDGTLDTSFDPGTGANNTVQSISTQNDGKILIGGVFTTHNGFGANFLVRLYSSSSIADWKMCTLSNEEKAGKRDTSFASGDTVHSGASSSVYTSAIQADGKILIGGAFGTYNGITRTRVARLNTDGSLDTSFDPGTGANSTVWQFSLQNDGKIIIVGQFTTYNGTARNRIARLNANGSLDTSFDPGTGASNQVYASAIQADGKIIIGGNFTSYNGTARARVARINADGSLDASFNPGTGVASSVAAVLIQSDGKILIGGLFTSYNGTARSKIARLNADGSLDTSFDPGTGANNTVQAIAVQSNGKILIGGVFTSYNGTARNYIARLNSDGTLDTSFDPGTGAGSQVRTAAIQSDGKILIGGDFYTYNGTSRSQIARLNADGSLDTSFDPGSGANLLVRTSSIQLDGKFFIGGDFSSYNGIARSRIARLNTDGTLDTSFDPGTGPNEYVYTTPTQADGKILIGGNFTAYKGIARSKVARLNSDGTLDTSFDPGTGANDVVRTSVIQTDGKIIIGGGFTTYNGTARNYIARLNTDGTLDTSFDPGTGASNTVGTSVIQSDGKILIGGFFTTYNGTARNYIARLNTDGTLDTSFDPGTGANVYVQEFAIQPDGKIIIGGNFTTYNGTARNYIARLNTDGTLDTSFDPGTGANSWVYASALQSDGKIIIGGNFTTYNGTARNYIARLNTDGTLDTSFDPGTGASSNVYTSAIQPDGKILIGGQFTTYNGTARNRIARLNTDGTLDTSFDPGTGASNTVWTFVLQSDGKILIAGTFSTYNSLAVPYLLRVFDKNQTDFTCSMSIPSYAQGQQSVYLRVIDANQNILTKLYSWLIDTVGPNKLKLAINENDKVRAGVDKLYVADKKFKLEFTADDKYSDVRYIKVSEYSDFRGANWKRFDGDIDIKLYGEGKHTLYIKTKDQNGNVSETYEQRIVLDTIAPILTLNTVSNVFNPTLSGTSEEGSYVKVWANGKVYGQDSSVPADGMWEVGKTNLLNNTDIGYGSNVISIETEDEAGNKTTTNFEHYIPLPIAEATVTQTDVEEPIQVLAANTAEEVPPAQQKTTPKPTDYIRYAIASIITLLVAITAALIKRKTSSQDINY